MAEKVKLEKQQAPHEVARHRTETGRSDVELMALHGVLSIISRTTGMDRLMPEILHTLADARIFPFEMKGTLSLLENGVLRRVSFTGLSEAELETCRYISPGECLCGRAVGTGEVIVSKNSREDRRHTLCSRGTAHGHVIVPLKTADRIVGVLSIYTSTDVALNGSMINFLNRLGTQVGIAIDNARHRGETTASNY